MPHKFAYLFAVFFPGRIKDNEISKNFFNYPGSELDSSQQTCITSSKFALQTVSFPQQLHPSFHPLDDGQAVEAPIAPKLERWPEAFAEQEGQCPPVHGLSSSCKIVFNDFHFCKRNAGSSHDYIIFSTSIFFIIVNAIRNSHQNLVYSWITIKHYPPWPVD